VFARSKFKGRHKYNKNDPRGVKKIIRSKWYPFQITRVKRETNNPTRLRQGLKPGTVVILLTGPYRGRRVVFLKQLKQSGLLLVTGPFGINGVPLRRVSQRFVIITSTRLAVGKIPELDNLEDAYFKKTATGKKHKKAPEKGDEKKQEAEQPAKQKREPFPEEKKKVQSAIDSKLGDAIAKVEYMKPYLTSYFTLRAGEPPHLIRFRRRFKKMRQTRTEEKKEAPQQKKEAPPQKKQ